MKSRIAVALLAMILSKGSTALAEDQNESSCINEECQLRKMQASQIFDGLANSIFHVAKITGAKTKKEKAEATLNLVGSVVQFAAEATRKSAKPEEDKPQETQEDQKQQKSDDGDISEKNTATKSIHTGYFEQIQTFSSDEEKMNYIANILQNEETTKELINELNRALESVLFGELFD
jgi:hypothetical protein